MKALFTICILFLSHFLIAVESPFSFFEPPAGWLMANPTRLDESVKIGFVQSERKVFTPAISLAIEKISCDEKSYLGAVKRKYRADPTRSIRELGLLKTKSGKAHLFQIDVKNTWGKIRLLQSILIKDETVYIHTASCLREDFLSLHQNFLESFRSLTVAPSPLASIENKGGLEEKLQSLFTGWKNYVASAQGKKEELFKASAFQKSEWIPFTHYVAQHVAEHGICWQILAIQHVKDQLIRGS